MLKITPTSQTETRVEYQLDGSLSGPWVKELQGVCEADLARGMTVALNLSNLHFIDQAGAALLKRLATQHVSQLNCSAFVRAHVQGGM